MHSMGTILMTVPKISSLAMMLMASMFVTSCAPTNNGNGCSGVNSVSGSTPGSNLQLGGFLDITDPQGNVVSRCTSVFSFNKDSEEKLNIDISTAKHCLFANENQDAIVRVWDGTGYLDIPIVSEYLKKSARLNSIIRKYGITGFSYGSEKNTNVQIFDSYLGAREKNSETIAISNQMKEEVVSFGAPICSIALSSATNEGENKNRPIQACFLYSEIQKFKATGELTNTIEKALYRTKKIPTSILTLEKPEKIIQKRWVDLQLEQTSADLSPKVDALIAQLANCPYILKHSELYPAELKKCENIDAIFRDLVDSNFIEESRMTNLGLYNGAYANYNHSQAEFEKKLKIWNEMKVDLFNAELVVMGNGKNPVTGELAFGASELSKIPAVAPHMHRSYGIVSHFDGSEVTIEPGASGSLLVADGVVIALLSSVDGVDTSSGRAQALPKSSPVEIAVIPAEPVSPVAGINDPVPVIVVAKNMPQASPSVQEPSAGNLPSSNTPDDRAADRANRSTNQGVIVTDSEIPDDFLAQSQVQACGT